MKEQTTNYKLALKQIKNLMNQALKLLPEKEQKQVDKDIFYDSRSDNDTSYINTLLHAKEFYMYYNDEFQLGLNAVSLAIYPDKKMEAYAMHRGQILGNLNVESFFEGDLQVLYDVLPSSSLERVISQERRPSHPGE